MTTKLNGIAWSSAVLPVAQVGLQSVFLLAVRVYLADIFLRSGLIKLQSWQTTLTLFEYEYEVPWLSAEVAAYLGTFGEIFFPALLLVGLAGRFSALALFIVNLVAAISYPDISTAGLKDHMLWGWLCTLLFVFGCGRISLDAWLFSRWRKVVRQPSSERSPRQLDMPLAAKSHL